MNIGKNIRILRKNKKMTLKELGSKVNLSEQAIGQYERGDREPNIETLVKIATALDTSLQQLLETNDTSDIDNIRSKTMDAMYSEIQNTINVNDASQAEYIIKMNSLYDKYFFDLLYWKTSRMAPNDFFKFMLSISQINEVIDLDESDIDELSVFFYRIVQLKSTERFALRKIEETSQISNYIEKFEHNYFLKTNNPK
ncbi:XRE family transcriptional regulator [Clostridium botulinum]|uniref:XRE family transcriptional regulator n=1 Tax=Clostridium botulinum TaxID=1491 RepID=A0A6M0STH3_CLOBO|nr:XRE family transcriptional regulator [Clostridium botulinum]